MKKKIGIKFGYAILGSIVFIGVMVFLWFKFFSLPEEYVILKEAKENVEKLDVEKLDEYHFEEGKLTNLDQYRAILYVRQQFKDSGIIFGYTDYSDINNIDIDNDERISSYYINSNGTYSQIITKDFNNKITDINRNQDSITYLSPYSDSIDQVIFSKESVDRTHFEIENIAGGDHKTIYGEIKDLNYSTEIYNNLFKEKNTYFEDFTNKYIKIMWSAEVRNEYISRIVLYAFNGNYDELEKLSLESIGYNFGEQQNVDEISNYRESIPYELYMMSCTYINEDGDESVSPFIVIQPLSESNKKEIMNIMQKLERNEYNIGEILNVFDQNE